MSQMLRGGQLLFECTSNDIHVLVHGGKHAIVQQLWSRCNEQHWSVSRSHITDGMSQMLRGGQLLSECTSSKEESLPVIKDCEWNRVSEPLSFN